MKSSPRCCWVVECKASTIIKVGGFTSLASCCLLRWARCDRRCVWATTRPQRACAPSSASATAASGASRCLPDNVAYLSDGLFAACLGLALVVCQPASRSRFERTECLEQRTSAISSVPLLSHPASPLPKTLHACPPAACSIAAPLLKFPSRSTGECRLACPAAPRSRRCRASSSGRRWTPLRRSAKVRWGWSPLLPPPARTARRPAPSQGVD